MFSKRSAVCLLLLSAISASRASWLSVFKPNLIGGAASLALLYRSNNFETIKRSMVNASYTTNAYGDETNFNSFGIAFEFFDYIGNPLMSSAGAACAAQLCTTGVMPSKRVVLGALGWSFGAYVLRELSQCVHNSIFYQVCNTLQCGKNYSGKSYTTYKYRTKTVLNTVGYAGMLTALAMNKPYLAYWCALYPSCTL